MGRGTRIMLPYVQQFQDKTGKVRRYFRRHGFPTRPLPGLPGSREFNAAYEAALAYQAPPVKIERNQPGTVASAISLYLGSTAFGKLAPDTRRTRRNELERFRAAKADKRLKLMERRHIEKYIRDKSFGSARNCLKALAPWLQWCVVEGLIAADITKGIARPTGSKEGYKTWPEDYVLRYRSHHAVGTKARLALELLVNTGAARVDVVQLGRQHVRDGIMSFRRHKTDVLVEIPVLDGLQAILNDMKATDRLSFLLTDYGKPFSPAGFGNWFRDRCDEAGIPRGYSSHGVRKYAATLRANMGATAHELMSWFGWLTMREAERYTRQAERRRLAVGLGKRLNERATSMNREP